VPRLGVSRGPPTSRGLPRSTRGRATPGGARSSQFSGERVRSPLLDQPRQHRGHARGAYLARVRHRRPLARRRGRPAGGRELPRRRDGHHARGAPRGLARRRRVAPAHLELSGRRLAARALDLGARHQLDARVGRPRHRAGAPAHRGGPVHARAAARRAHALPRELAPEPSGRAHGGHRRHDDLDWNEARGYEAQGPVLPYFADWYGIRHSDFADHLVDGSIDPTAHATGSPPPSPSPSSSP
jgi:hypothetical protein